MDQASNIRTGEELDWTKLREYLHSVLPQLDEDMEVSQFHGGHANLTYLLRFGAKELVLRRPPFGKIAPGAHDMKREYRVLSKLYRFFPAAPRAYHLCEDDSVIGAKFVIMERRSGVVLRYRMLDCFAGFPRAEERLTEAMIRAEADLHRVDVQAAGLEQLGKPKGFVIRQLAGWKKRWELAKTEENPDMDRTFANLSIDVPKPQAVSIVHNDIKFDNCQFQPDDPDTVTSIFDWDMATLGDPLVDLGSTLSYWPDERLQEFENLPVTLQGNFPSKQFLIAKYGECSGFSMEKVGWYESFAYWKGAVIAQQLYKRYCDGATTDQRMAGFGESAKVLAMLACRISEDI